MSTIKEIMQSLNTGETRPSDWVDRALQVMRGHDDKIGAFLTIDEDGARAKAAALDNQVVDHPLYGIPYALKDNMCTEGLRTTAGSRILENYIPPFTGTAAKKLETAGGILMGKTNLDEFAMGSSTENSAYQRTRNPHALEYVPGGSSGGSAAAVAAGMVPFALGSDTGGSIRQPAAYCGVVGMKPTYGSVSRYGLIAFASSLDQIGPFTRTVEDAAYVMQAICGHDPLDSTTAPGAGIDYLSSLQQGVKGLRVGVVMDSLDEGLDEEVKQSVINAIEVLRSAGAEIVDVSLPNAKYAVAAYYLVAPAEASSNLARFDGVRYGLRSDSDSLLEMYQRTRSEGFGMEVKRRIMIGTYALSSGYYDAYYLRGLKMRTKLGEDFDAAFAQCDVIVTPTAPTPAFKFGHHSTNPLQMYLNDIFTVPANLVGLPGISVPCGLSSMGLPMGVQFLGRKFDDGTMLRAAHTYEQLRGFDMPLPRMGG